MSIWLRRFFAVNLPLSILLGMVLILPDHIMLVISDRNNAIYQLWYYIAIIGLASLILLVKRTSVIYFVIAVFWITETAHFCYMAYFGGVISASAILQFFIEYADVFAASSDLSHYLYYAPLIVFIPYAVAITALRIFRHNRATVPFIWVVLLAVISIVPYRIISEPDRAVKYYPNASFPSIANSYLNLSTLFFNHIPKLVMPGIYDTEQLYYSPVIISQRETPEQMTIVVIMTEGITYDHMNLYGYERDTTPFLSSLKQDPDFVWKPGISAGISTRVSFVSFWNDVRDPRNTQQFIRKPTNLFRLAGKNGFYNQFLSAQGSNLLRDSGTEYIHVLYTEDSLTPVSGEQNDNSLLLMARDIELHDKNFIVFHTRTAHAAYTSNYTQNQEFAIYPEDGVDYNQMLVNTYDNAIRYSDSVIENLIKTMISRVDGPLYFIVTSDHGQLFGNDVAKTFGHGKLVSEIGRVPIIFYSVNGDQKWLDSARDFVEPTHYELTTFMLSMFGYDIDDRNENDKIYYINGLGYHHGENGYIKIDKSKFPQNSIEYTVYPKS